MSAARRHGNPALLGLFVLVALSLLFITVFTVAGGRLLTSKQRVVMHFGGSVYGLQVGAPVVFRGVRLGSVTTIGVAYNRASNSVTIPVEAELETSMVRNVSGGGPSEDRNSVLPGLVERGLRAQLAMQSLLTGQLYVDLDFRLDKPALRVGSATSAETEIPTISTAIQDLKNQVDNLDIRRLVDDISAIASSARKLVSGPELAHALKEIEATTIHLHSLTERLDKRVDPLADTTRAAMESTRLAMDRVASAANRVSDSAQRVGSTFGPDAPLVQSLRNTADELGRSAVALRAAAADDSPLNQNLQRALQDVARSARALRELADLLDQQPESVLKGRR
jgi:paraquat-inducible protein B